ncbi:hypothetical protein [Acidisphaera sp. S103]|uniref:hypothetical protein n=1 Tax=Acidisphaera sp. S103 TaxID=1747223 RepID=UPI00131AAA74|nr:hypothetical protein [Acidisphaera sp. S103]
MQNLTDDETRSLRCVAGMMIPASAAHAVPGADDDTIFADIVAGIGRDMAHVKQALHRLDHLAGDTFADRDLATRLTDIGTFQKDGGVELAALNRIVVQCYYRDDRVMRSLGMDVRPPFPKGFEVEQGDWSLLDPVRARPAFYRRTP